MDEMDINNSPIVFARKPLEENTVVDNVLKWGTGGINIDESRIGVEPTDPNHRHNPSMGNKGKNSIFGVGGHSGNLQVEGRFPANLILDTEAAKVLDEQTGVLSNAGSPKKTDSSKTSIFGAGLPEKIYSDRGGASRFFYQPKGDADYENTDKKENNMRLLLGDCLDKLKELEDNSVDSIVTDPPYGLSFMGKAWDYDVPTVDIWKECLRVLKPGGHLLAFAGSRTYHRMAVRIEDAGFEIRDMISWLYGSGFPKSMDISKQIDKKFGKLDEREDIGIYDPRSKYDGSDRRDKQLDGPQFAPARTSKLPITTPATDEAKQWSGWGTALKPAHEPVVMARKPLEENTVVDNVLKWGTGGINIDESRISTDETITNHSRSSESAVSKGKYGDSKEQETHQTDGQKLGRFPANLILDEEAGEVLDEQSGTSKSTGGRSGNKEGIWDGRYNGEVRDENPGFGDSGGASRFFYCPKVSKSERNEGLDGFDKKVTRRDDGQPYGMNTNKFRPDGTERKPVEAKQNHHPTVKPVDLMIYLIRLVTPKDGVILDPFMGSGSSGKAAVRGGFDFIGIERDEEYFEIAEARIEYERNKPIIVETPTGKKVEVKKEVEEKINQFFE
jgi:DNA modification methylase